MRMPSLKQYIPETPIVLPKFHADQQRIYQEILNSDLRYHLLVMGRRWGKTEFLTNWAISCAMRMYWDTARVRKRGGYVGIFTAEFKQFVEIFDSIEYYTSKLLIRKSRTHGLLRFKNGGLIDFWATDDNVRAGRGREYDSVLLDEVGLTKDSEFFNEVWSKAIRPTLMTRNGICIAAGTPMGVNENNFAYKVWNEHEKHRFMCHHAPTWGNPFVPEEEIEKARKEYDPRVFKQEIEAEFIDWSGEAFFDIEKLLVNNEPVEFPPYCDAVYAVIDTALKDGKENDGTGIMYFGVELHYSPVRLYILDYDIIQIRSGFMENYIPHVNYMLDEYAKKVMPRRGNLGIFIEDTNVGSTLADKSVSLGWNMNKLDTVLTSLGKDARAVMASPHYYQEKVKITHNAFNKVVDFKQKTANHFLKQLGGYFLADKNAKRRPDDLLDCFTYGIIISFGSSKAI